MSWRRSWKQRLLRGRSIGAHHVPAEMLQMTVICHVDIYIYIYNIYIYTYIYIYIYMT